MGKFDMSALAQQAEDAGLLQSSGGFYKFKEGDNRFRLVSECLPHTSTFKDGKKSFKWLCYVLDRRTGKIMAHFMPHTIYKQIAALQIDPDYAFDEVPMPYDLNVKAKGAGTKEVEYSLIPARTAKALTAEERADLAAQKTLSELKDAINTKKQAAPQEPPPTTEEPEYPLDHEPGDSPVPF